MLVASDRDAPGSSHLALSPAPAFAESQETYLSPDISMTLYRAAKSEVVYLQSAAAKLKTARGRGQSDLLRPPGQER